MTIIKNSSFSRFYPFVSLDVPVRTLMEESFNAHYPISINRPMLKAFDAYCHLIEQKVTYLTLSTAEFVEVITGFVGALHKNCLLYQGSLTRSKIASAFIDMINKVRVKIPSLPFFDKAKFKRKTCYPAWVTLKVKIKENSIHYWNGWEILSSKG